MAENNRHLIQRARRILRRLAIVAAIAGGLFALGTLAHEAGHGLAAIAFGGRLVRLNVLGLQLYPSPAWDFQPGCFGRTWWRGEFTPAQLAWISLSGNVATMSISIISLPLYLCRRWRGAAHTTLLTLSLYFLDTLAHTLPTFGLPMFLLFGNRSVERISEGYLAAAALGAPGWAFQAAIVGYALLAAALIGHKLWSERPRKHSQC